MDEDQSQPARPPTAAAFGFNYRQVLIVLVVSWAVRFCFAWFMPPQVRSTDTYSWEACANLLLAGQNPYRETTALNWPPFWLQCIYLIGKVSHALDVPFVQVLRVFLTAVESLIILALFRLIRQLAPQARPFVPILLGIALNPIAVLLTCQHGNFDLIVGLWVLLFAGQLAAYYRSRNPMDWLAAGMFLGLGILTKTVPLVLLPMLAGGWRRASRRLRLVGMALVFGPVVLGTSVIYVLAPGDVISKVLDYRSSSGWFGISGLLYLAGAENLIGFTNLLFYAGLAVAGAMVARMFWRREMVEGREIILGAALFLAAIPGIGSGYGSQYIYWFLPLLIASYSLYGRAWRGTLMVFGVVGVITYLVEYGLFRSHGQYLIFLLGDHGELHTTVKLHEWLMRAIRQEGQVEIRLPMFAAYLGLLIGGAGRLLKCEKSVDRESGDPKLWSGRTLAVFAGAICLLAGSVSYVEFFALPQKARPHFVFEITSSEAPDRPVRLTNNFLNYTHFGEDTAVPGWVVVPTDLQKPYIILRLRLINASAAAAEEPRAMLLISTNFSFGLDPGWSRSDFEIAIHDNNVTNKMDVSDLQTFACQPASVLSPGEGQVLPDLTISLSPLPKTGDIVLMGNARNSGIDALIFHLRFMPATEVPSKFADVFRQPVALMGTNDAAGRPVLNISVEATRELPR